MINRLADHSSLPQLGPLLAPVVFFGCSAIMAAMAADIHVSISGAGEAPYETPANGLTSIHLAIAASQPGDRILVGPGLFAENLVIPHHLTIMGEGMHRTVIDGGRADSCLVVAEGVSLALKDIALLNGQSRQGGGIEIYRGDLLLERVLIQDCSAGRGGGLYAKFSSVTVVESVFDRCRAEVALQSDGGKGGGVYLIGTMTGPTAHFQHCRFSGNWAKYGGAVRLWTGKAMFHHTHFLDNRAEFDVLEANEFSSASFVNCLVIGNQSLLAGHLAYLNASVGQVSHCTVSTNRSLAQYSVFYADLYSVVKLWNSAFQTNQGDGLDVPFGTSARGCAFSTPPFRLKAAAPLEGTFHSGPDGDFYLARALGEDSVFIGLGDPECPDLADAAQRKVYATGVGTGSGVDAGYGYPFGTTAVLEHIASPAWHLQASGSPLLDYSLEASDNARFRDGLTSLALGPLTSRKQTVLEQPLNPGNQFYRIRGRQPKNFSLSVDLADPTDRPLANLRVDVLAAADGQWLASGWTNAQGTARIDNLPAGHFTAFGGADSLEYVPLFLGDTTGLEAAERVSLSPQTPHLTTKITLAEGGGVAVLASDGTAPVTGAEISLYTADEKIYKRAITDDQGMALVGGLPTGVYRVGGTKKPEYADLYWENAATLDQALEIQISGTQNQNVTLQMVAKARFGGTVHGADFEPLPGIFVVAYESGTQAEIAFALSDLNGQFSLYVPGGTYFLSAGEGGEYAPQYSQSMAIGMGGTIENLDFFLTEGGMISGSVHLSDGTPAGNIFVDFFTRTDGQYMWLADAYVDTLGDFLSPVLPPDTYYVQAYGEPVYTNNWYTGSSGSQPIGIPVAAGEMVKEIHITVHLK